MKIQFPVTKKAKKHKRFSGNKYKGIAIESIFFFYIITQSKISVLQYARIHKTREKYKRLLHL